MDPVSPAHDADGTPADVRRPRLVLDTNVCLDVFVFVDPRCEPLHDAMRSGRIELVTRADCREEWMRVLHYPALALDDDMRARHAETFDQWTRWIDVPSDSRLTLPRCRDTDDQKFLELARDSGAVALVTRDAELLKLAARMRRLGTFVIVEPTAIGAHGLPGHCDALRAFRGDAVLLE